MLALTGWVQRPVFAAVSQDPLVPVYQEAAREYDIPWTLLAAIDRYAELSKTKSERQAAPYYGYAFEPALWAGIGNPDWSDVNPWSIDLFGGIGQDHNHDMLALPWDANDRIPVLAAWLDTEAEDVDVAVWDLFQDEIAIDRVFAFERIFDQYGLHPTRHCFPLAKRYNYTVKYTFGAGRSFGGRRRHEGVDIFADYGTPVLACSTAYVEVKGWNPFGGWRIGLRDTNNVYYYYAHLSSYAKGIHIGDVVQPGQVIGYVGNTGYGPPGTAGRFPPHLHFGMYRDVGQHEWAFNPAGPLSVWQRLPQKIIPPPID
ncbi:M23 family metallopeptidase [Alicyclobacillus cycloheptanicus]|nr:M23 family metallopeptidase [Alicyclobacillus cycloheptanicus]